MPAIVLPHMRQKIYKSIIVSGISVLLPFCVILVYSFAIAKAVLLGCALWVVIQALCAIRLFHQIETTPKKFILKFYQTEVAKLLLISIAFVCLFKWTEISVPGLIIGYIWTQAVFLGSMFK